jgi:hypothetical protein
MVKLVNSPMNRDQLLRTMNWFGHFYHGEISQFPNEQGPVVTDNELVY